MIEFVLILIMGGSGKAIHSIPFPTQDECVFAGNAAAKIEYVRWTCVPRTTVVKP